MKLLRLTISYPQYLDRFFKKRVDLLELDFQAMTSAYCYDGFAQTDSWSYALKSLGYEAQDIFINAWPMQRQWARENGMQAAVASLDAFSQPSPEIVHQIALAQVAKYQPEILFFNLSDATLLRKIKERFTSIKFIFGWTGSALANRQLIADLDLILSCSPEAVTRLREEGARAQHIHHAFDQRILQRISGRKFDHGLAFSGQLLFSEEYHIRRLQFLGEIARALPVDIFSDLKAGVHLPEKSERWSIRRRLRRLLKGSVSNSQTARSPLVDLSLARIHAPLFGLEMYELLRDSGVSLNIHADSSPRYASNFRLYETTGVSGVLLTDWKENIDELFEDGKEVVTFKSIEECLEKARWLLDHPREREAIARAGQSRTLAEHTFAHRAPLFDQIIRQNLRG
jgi:spore maturation protein CgeB